MDERRIPVTTILDLIGVLLVAAGVGLGLALLWGIWAGLIAGGVCLLGASFLSDKLRERGPKQ